ncbi:unknown [Lachnospiraceae bacterium CAG:215]|nr:unknown [Lachnospiraceae bacterium CAG:215]
MLDHGLSASERSRNRCHTAFCDREKCIDDTLSRYKRHLRRQFLLIRTSAADRPFLHHRQFLVPVLRLDNADNILHGELTGFDLFNFSFHSVRNHDLLLYNDRLLYGSEHVALRDFVSNLHGRNKFPFQIPFQGRYFHTTFQAVSRNFHDIIQRSLDSVVNTCDQSGSQFNGHRYAHRLHRFSRSESRSLLINLNRRLVSVYLNDFANQSLFTDTNHVKHVRVAHSRCNDKRSCDFFNYACAHFDELPTFLIPVKTEYRNRPPAPQSF